MRNKVGIFFLSLVFRYLPITEIISYVISRVIDISYQTIKELIFFGIEQAIEIEKKYGKNKKGYEKLLELRNRIKERFKEFEETDGKELRDSFADTIAQLSVFILKSKGIL